jgi:hypothetical protein
MPSGGHADRRAHAWRTDGLESRGIADDPLTESSMPKIRFVAALASAALSLT